MGSRPIGWQPSQKGIAKYEVSAERVGRGVTITPRLERWSSGGWEQHCAGRLAELTAESHDRAAAGSPPTPVRSSRTSRRCAKRRGLREHCWSKLRLLDKTGARELSDDEGARSGVRCSR